MNEDFDITDKSTKEVKEIVKDILRMLPRHTEHSLIPRYYKFNEDLETIIHPISHENDKLYNLCMSASNLAWIKGFNVAIKYHSSVSNVPIHNEPREIVNEKLEQSDAINTDLFIEEFYDDKTWSNVFPIIIVDWGAFIFGIFCASFVWFVAVLSGLLG